MLGTITAGQLLQKSAERRGKDSNATTNIAQKLLLQVISKLTGSNWDRGVKVRGKERTFLAKRQKQTTPVDNINVEGSHSSIRR